MSESKRSPEESKTLDEYIQQQIQNNLADIVQKKAEQMSSGLTEALKAVDNFTKSIPYEFYDENSNLSEEQYHKLKARPRIDLHNHRAVLPTEAARRNQAEMDAYTRRNIQEKNERHIRDAFLKGNENYAHRHTRTEDSRRNPEPDRQPLAPGQPDLASAEQLVIHMLLQRALGHDTDLPQEARNTDEAEELYSLVYGPYPTRMENDR